MSQATSADVVLWVYGRAREAAGPSDDGWAIDRALLDELIEDLESTAGLAERPEACDQARVAIDAARELRKALERLSELDKPARGGAVFPGDHPDYDRHIRP